MIYNGGKVLVQERKKQDWPGIAFPGGHVEAGESFTEAVIQEVWEERENLPNLRLAETDMMDVLRVFEDNLSEFFYRQVGDNGFMN